MTLADAYLVDSNILLRIPRRDDSDHALVAGAVARRVSTTLRHSVGEFSEYFRFGFVVC